MRKIDEKEQWDMVKIFIGILIGLFIQKVFPFIGDLIEVITMLMLLVVLWFAIKD